jgi:hypothetical protein
VAIFLLNVLQVVVMRGKFNSSKFLDGQSTFAYHREFSTLLSSTILISNLLYPLIDCRFPSFSSCSDIYVEGITPPHAPTIGGSEVVVSGKFFGTVDHQVRFRCSFVELVIAYRLTGVVLDVLASCSQRCSLEAKHAWVWRGNRTQRSSVLYHLAMLPITWLK